MTAITGGELWLEGSAENKKDALANAILNANEIPSTQPGMKVIIMIDALWEDDEGNFHAKVLFQQVPDPEAQNNNDNEAKAEDIKRPHDGLTSAHGPEDDALRYTPDMEEADHEMENAFDEATHEDANKDLGLKEKAAKPKTAGQPAPVPDGTEEKEEEGY